MKHIKLFEQFIDTFDPFGEEKENEYIIHTNDILKCKKTFFLDNIEEFTAGKLYKVTKSYITVEHHYLNPMQGSIYMEGNKSCGVKKGI